MTFLGLGPGEGWAAFVLGLWPGRRASQATGFSVVHSGQAQVGI